MTAIYPGSFDPVTNGHINIARRGAATLGYVIVAVLDNPHKTPMFTIHERVALLREVFAEDENIEVDSFSGLLADYVIKKGAKAIIRGLRSPEDLAKEMPYANWNRQITAGLAQSVETLYFTTEPCLAHISGSIIKEAAAHIFAGGLDDTAIARAVPASVLAALRDKLV